MSDRAAELRRVTVEYPSHEGPVRALREVSIEFPRGTSTAIVGRSGSGKSTLTSVLSLMRQPQSGQVFLDGQLVSEMSGGEMARTRSTTVGLVFQSYHLEPSLTAIENVMLPWYFSPDRDPKRVAARRAAEILERLDIAALARRRTNQMSGGQRQRVAIARALFSRPSLFIADEPTGNLDEETANLVAETIFSLPSSFATTVVVVTHDHAIASLADFRRGLVRGRFAND